MRIVEDTPTRLVLAGIVGSWWWMTFATVLGVALTGAVVAGAVHEIGRGNWWSLIWLTIGFAIAQLVFWMGAVTLAVGRERLELDLTTGKGEFWVRSPIVTPSSKPFKFDLANVHSVSLERSSEHRPGGVSGSGHHRADQTAQVVRARLRTIKPRRAVVLDETENGQEKRVRPIAERVAAFLDLEVAEK